MAKPKWTPSEKQLLAACKQMLNGILTEWASDPEPKVDIDSIDAELRPRIQIKKIDVQMHLKNRRMVDDAMAEMWVRLLNTYEFGKSKSLVELERESARAEIIEKQAYHYAVDAYFKIYRGRKRGRPPLSPGFLTLLHEQVKAGMSNKEIAEKRGLIPVAKVRDRIRKQRNKALTQERKK